MVGATFAGQPRAAGWQSYAAHWLTPEGATSTRYFLAVVSAAAQAKQHVNDAEVRAILQGILAGADSPMVCAVQDLIGGSGLWDLKPVTLPDDTGVVAVRHALGALLAEERG